MSKLSSLAQRIKDAQPQIAHASTPLKNQILLRIANRLIESTDEILEANRADLSRASQNGIPNVMLDRLSLSEERIHALHTDGRLVLALKTISAPICKSALLSM